MKIKALVPFSTGTISMEQYEVKEVTETIGEQLVAAGVAVEIGGGSGGGVLVVTDTDGTLDKTWQEIHDAGFAVLWLDDGADILSMDTCFYQDGEGYSVSFNSLAYGDPILYRASSASGYPTTSN